jgi:predicted TPR repeat methyltransferase
LPRGAEEFVFSRCDFLWVRYSWNAFSRVWLAGRLTICVRLMCMASVEEHYNQHLGPVYRWMIGDVPAALQRSQAELESLDITPGATRLAVDLGAGIGLHAIPLSRLGFEVIAIEASTPMAEELRREATGLPVQIVDGDLLQFRNHLSGSADVVVCMGDTLTHLPSKEAVAQLLSDVAGTLSAGGIFVATFRDYSGAGPSGANRFIPVRSDEHRILTCFLEYAEETITVSDLLNERGVDGWQLRVSSYPKLRLAPAWVVAQLEAMGLTVEQGKSASGMVRVIARRV